MLSNLATLTLTLSTRIYNTSYVAIVLLTNYNTLRGIDVLKFSDVLSKGALAPLLRSYK